MEQSFRDSKDDKRREELLQRFLWVPMALVGLTLMAWPTGERLYSVWSQQQLQAAFKAESRRAALHGADKPSNRESAPQHLKAAQNKTPSGGQPAPRSKPAWKPLVVNQGKQGAPQAKRWQPTQIIIPDIQLEAVVVSSVSESALRRGPGHDPATAMPGQKGNCVIAAHRNAYGWWFNKLDEIENGDLIHLETPQNYYVYEVAFSKLVDSNDNTMLAPPSSPSAVPRLTLYTCTLPKSQRRLVVVANLVAS